MYQKLQDVTLKTEERVELGVVLAPENDSALGAQMRKLLGHKGESWIWQVEKSLSSSYPNMETRFYILLKAGAPFANIMTAESCGVGIFGHVWTTPAERRKGAADIIHHYLMADFKKRGGQALYLGTDYDTHPYRLYTKYGFQGVEPRSGYMYWFAKGQEAFESAAFAPAKIRHEALTFQHWPTLSALAMMKHPARIRIANMNVINICSPESGSLSFIRAMDGKEQDLKSSAARAWLAISEKSNLPVAIASLKPDTLFGEQVDVVDIFCAPGFEADLPKLYEKLQANIERRAVCYADTLWPAKFEALKRCGFEKTATLKRYLRAPDCVLDVELWSS
ncbi:MAG: hypothetical protein V1899_09265 [Planctomycetota bacterium]